MYNNSHFCCEPGYTMFFIMLRKPGMHGKIYFLQFIFVFLGIISKFYFSKIHYTEGKIRINHKINCFISLHLTHYFSNWLQFTSLLNNFVSNSYQICFKFVSHSPQMSFQIHFRFISDWFQICFMFTSNSFRNSNSFSG